MHYNIQCLLSVRRLGMRERVKTRRDYGLRIWIFLQKLPFSVEKKCFNFRQIQEVQYTIPIRHITNISDFVWFLRSCGSMKSVSSFSSIDLMNDNDCKDFYAYQLNYEQAHILKYINIPKKASQPLTQKSVNE